MSKEVYDDHIIVRLNDNNVSQCGVCDKDTISNKCAPFFNGNPTSSILESEGYKVLCVTCYEAWVKTDNDFINTIRNLTL